MLWSMQYTVHQDQILGYMYMYISLNGYITWFISQTSWDRIWTPMMQCSTDPWQIATK